MVEKRKEEEHHIEEFVSRLRSFCGDLSVVPGYIGDHVAGDVSLHRLGQFDMLDIDCDLSAVIRDERTAAHDGGHHFFFIHQRDGRSLIEQSGRRFEALPGSFFMLDDTQPFRILSPQARVKQYSLHIPRCDMPADLLTTDLAGASLTPADVVGSMMLHLLGEVLKARDDAAQLTLATDAFFDLLRLHLRSVRGLNSKTDIENYHLTIFARAHHIIDVHFRNSDFGASDLAAMINLPIRQLQRAFAQSDNSPARAIIERRLTYARNQLERLCEGAVRNNIAEVAYDAGFNDLSYFYRAFRERYGCPPGDLARNSTPPD